MVFNKLSVDAVQVKDKCILLRYVVRTMISVVFRHVLFIEVKTVASNQRYWGID